MRPHVRFHLAFVTCNLSRKPHAVRHPNRVPDSHAREQRHARLVLLRSVVESEHVARVVLPVFHRSLAGTYERDAACSLAGM